MEFNTDFDTFTELHPELDFAHGTTPATLEFPDPGCYAGALLGEKLENATVYVCTVAGVNGVVVALPDKRTYFVAGDSVGVQACMVHVPPLPDCE